MASGTNNTFRQIGIATGIAALGALFQSSIATKLDRSDGNGTRPRCGHGRCGRPLPAVARAARARRVHRLPRLDPHRERGRGAGGIGAGARPPSRAPAPRRWPADRGSHRADVTWGARPDRSGELLAHHLTDARPVGATGHLRHHVRHHTTEVAQRCRAHFRDDVVDDLLESSSESGSGMNSSSTSTRSPLCPPALRGPPSRTPRTPRRAASAPVVGPATPRRRRASAEAPSRPSAGSQGSGRGRRAARHHARAAPARAIFDASDQVHDEQCSLRGRSMKPGRPPPPRMCQCR